MIARAPLLVNAVQRGIAARAAGGDAAKCGGLLRPVALTGVMSNGRMIAKMFFALWAGLAITVFPGSLQEARSSASAREKLQQPDDQGVKALTAEELCDRLLEQARLIDRQLRSVTDQASADRAADELDASINKMLHLLSRLEELSPADADESQRMMDKLNDLVRIAQNYTSLISRIVEVNAYGSEKLMRVLETYKMLDFCVGSDSSSSSDSGYQAVFEEMGDCLDDVLYLVRKVKDKESAQEAVRKLAPLVVKLEGLRRSIDAQPGILSESRSDALRRNLQRIRRLQTELSEQNERLRGKGYFEAPVLEVMIRDCERACI